MKRKHNIIGLLLTFVLLVPSNLFGQTLPVIITEDSLALDTIIQVVIQNHPTVKEAAEALQHAEAQIGLARSGYYPNINFSANYSRVGPVPSLEIPNLGSFTLFPANNFSGGLSLYQNIYDFGKTEKTLAVAEAGKALASESLEQVKQKMAEMVIRVYYSLEFLQEAIKIKEEQLGTLNEHLAFVQMMAETGSATQYEILSTKVKISGVKNQKLDLEAAREAQLTVLNGLLGLPAETFHTVKKVLDISQPRIAPDSLLLSALQQRDEMQIAKEKTEMALLRLDQVKSQTRPTLNFIASGGWKNGYVPDINKIKANYVVGLGLTVPVFEGTRTKYMAMEAKSNVETSTYQTEIAKRKISGEVIRNETAVETAFEKVKQSKLQLQQAKEALDLARTSYKAGAVTNLDLLDAATGVSESQLMLLKAQIGFMVSVYELRAAIGDRLY